MKRKETNHIKPRCEEGRKKGGNMHKTASITCHGGKNTQHDIYVTEDARMRQVHVFIYMFYNLLDQRHTTVQVVVWWIQFTPDFLW